MSGWRVGYVIGPSNFMKEYLKVQDTITICAPTAGQMLALEILKNSMEEIDAEIVIIKTPGKELVIKNPQVSKVNMMGQETFQVVGDITEVEKDQEVQINEEDISTVVEQTKCTREEAKEALEQNNGNLAEAILKLQNK